MNKSHNLMGWQKEIIQRNKQCIWLLMYHITQFWLSPTVLHFDAKAEGKRTMQQPLSELILIFFYHLIHIETLGVCVNIKFERFYLKSNPK
jgi:hypothetical protein